MEIASMSLRMFHSCWTSHVSLLIGEGLDAVEASSRLSTLVFFTTLESFLHSSSCDEERAGGFVATEFAEKLVRGLSDELSKSNLAPTCLVLPKLIALCASSLERISNALQANPSFRAVVVVVPSTAAAAARLEQESTHFITALPSFSHTIMSGDGNHAFLHMHRTPRSFDVPLSFIPLTMQTKLQPFTHSSHHTQSLLTVVSEDFLKASLHFGEWCEPDDFALHQSTPSKYLECLRAIQRTFFTSPPPVNSDGRKRMREVNSKECFDRHARFLASLKLSLVADAVRISTSKPLLQPSAAVEGTVVQASGGTTLIVEGVDAINLPPCLAETIHLWAFTGPHHNLQQSCFSSALDKLPEFSLSLSHETDGTTNVVPFEPIDQKPLQSMLLGLAVSLMGLPPQGTDTDAHWNRIGHLCGLSGREAAEVFAAGNFAQLDAEGDEATKFEVSCFAAKQQNCGRVVAAALRQDRELPNISNVRQCLTQSVAADANVRAALERQRSHRRFSDFCDVSCRAVQHTIVAVEEAIASDL